MLTGVAGCPPGGPHRKPFAPLDLPEAIELVNHNSLALQTTLKAKAGHARGYFTEPDGAKRRFDLDAALLVRPPRCMRFDLSTFGKSQLIFGSNRERYWMVQPSAKALTWGRYDHVVDPMAHDLIIRPDLMLEALGLTPMPTDTSGDRGPLQRITADNQQILFLDYDDTAQAYISKEYWVSRYAPQLIERIIFRDSHGVMVMDSRLGDYRPLRVGGPRLPHRIEVRWPATDGYLLFTARGWQELPQVTEAHPGFVFPLDRGQSFRKVVDIDAALENRRSPTPAAPLAALTVEDCHLPPRSPLRQPLLAILPFATPADPGLGPLLADTVRPIVKATQRYRILGGVHDAGESVADITAMVALGHALRVQQLLGGVVRSANGTTELTLTLIDVSRAEAIASIPTTVVGQPEQLSGVLGTVTCELLRQAREREQAQSPQE